MKRRHHQLKKQHPRRGSLYMSVVITASIVSLIALSSLLVQRISRSAYNDQHDLIEARLNAETATRMAVLEAFQNENWRFEHPNGDWQSNVAFGNGTLTINVEDPADGDLGNDTTHEAVVTGIGMVGSAVQKVQLNIASSVEPIDALHSTLHAGDDLKFDSVTLTGTGVGTANDDSKTTGTNSISHNIGAVYLVSGGTYQGTTTPGIDPIELPVDPLDFYKETGTWLNISDIVTSATPPAPAPLVPPQKISNTGFETELTPWEKWTPGSAYQVIRSATAARTGGFGCAITGRNAAWEGPSVDITSFVQNGIPYDVSVWIRSVANCDATITIKTVGTTSGDSFFNIGPWDPVTSTWTKLEGVVVPEWSGNLTEAILYVETNHTDDFEVDDFSMVDPYEGAQPTGSNLLVKGDMESSPLTDWYSIGAVIETSPTGHNGSAQAITAVSRNALTDTLAQDVTSEIENGATYHAEGWVRIGGSREVARLALKLTMDDGSVQFVGLTAWRDTLGGTYAKCYGQATVSWTGTVSTAEFIVENQTSVNGTVQLDNAALFEVASAPPPAHTIYRTVLSPNSNPFGSGTTNAQGIYVIDCGFTDVYIKDSRIVGTLVLLNPGTNSRVLDGALEWSPARPNFPALLVDGSFTIATGTEGLNESLLDMNFNPTGTPSPWSGGTSDSDKSDTYVSNVKGLIYSNDELTIGGATVFEGNAISVKDLTLTGNIEIQDTDAARQNPPPGFLKSPKVYFLENSVRKAFD